MEKLMIDIRQRMKVIRELFREVEDMKKMATEDGDKMIYDTLSGSSIGENVFTDPSISIQKGILEPATTMKPHTHDNEDNILILLNGDMTVTMENVNGGIQQINIQDRGYCVITKKVQHIVETKEGCQLIAITIPSSLAYPK